MDSSDWVASPGGWALDFDGTNDNINYGTEIKLGGVKQASFSAWVWRATQGDMITIGRYNTSLGGGNYRADYFGPTEVTAAGQVVLFVGGTASGNHLLFYSTEQMIAGQWNHVAGSVLVDGNSSTCALALNGKPCTVNTSHAGTRPTAFADNNAVPWRSMAITGGLGSIFYNSGQLGEIAVWNSQKTIVELCSLHGLGNGALGRFAIQGPPRHAYKQMANRRRRIICGAEC